MRLLMPMIAVVLAGCQYDPYTWDYTKNQPKPEDVVGTYVPDQATGTLITGEGHYPRVESSITLAADGSLTITNIPD